MMEPILRNSVEGMPRTDYPRPQWKRKDWYCLNGDWEFAFDLGNSGIERGMVEDGDYPLKNTHRLLYRVTKALDPYRPVIDASGGMHYETDMFDVHDYEQDPKKFAEYLAPMLEDEKAFHSPISRYRGNAPCRPDTYTGQPYWVSEYGGTFWNTLAAKNSDAWGYGENPADEEEFAARYEGLTKVLLEHPRVCGFCYTQLTDIEQEQNGLYYYDRTRKLPDWVYECIRVVNTRKAAVEE